MDAPINASKNMKVPIDVCKDKEIPSKERETLEEYHLTPLMPQLEIYDFMEFEGLPSRIEGALPIVLNVRLLSPDEVTLTVSKNILEIIVHQPEREVNGITFTRNYIYDIVLPEGVGAEDLCSEWTADQFLIIKEKTEDEKYDDVLVPSRIGNVLCHDIDPYAYLYLINEAKDKCIRTIRKRIKSSQVYITPKTNEITIEDILEKQKEDKIRLRNIKSYQPEPDVGFRTVFCSLKEESEYLKFTRDPRSNKKRFPVEIDYRLFDCEKIFLEIIDGYLEIDVRGLNGRGDDKRVNKLLIYELPKGIKKEDLRFECHQNCVTVREKTEEEKKEDAELRSKYPGKKLMLPGNFESRVTIYELARGRKMYALSKTSEGDMYRISPEFDESSV